MNARTLAETHEAEFLRYRKLTADGRDLQVSARDLYDMGGAEEADALRRGVVGRLLRL